jgi:hypothetical protein
LLSTFVYLTSNKPWNRSRGAAICSAVVREKKWKNKFKKDLKPGQKNKQKKKTEQSRHFYSIPKCTKTTEKRINGQNKNCDKKRFRDYFLIRLIVSGRDGVFDFSDELDPNFGDVVALQRVLKTGKTQSREQVLSKTITVLFRMKTY